MITNQRYSITGQPLLYLGNSAMCVVQEITPENFSELNISSFLVKNTLAVYDLNPKLFEHFVLEQSTPILNPSLEDTLKDRNIKTDFFHYILYALCSFPRKIMHKDSKFCEEYVLPQLLAQITNSMKFKGIAYPATSSYDGKTFGINYALFTKYNENHVYDKSLYDKFEISSPISINDIYPVINLSLDTYTGLILEIIKYFHYLLTTQVFQKDESNLINLFELASKIYNEAIKLNNVFPLDSFNQNENNAWKLHCYLLYLKLIEIKQKLYLLGGDNPNV